MSLRAAQTRDILADIELACRRVTKRYARGLRVSGCSPGHGASFSMIIEGDHPEMLFLAELYSEPQQGGSFVLPSGWHLCSVDETARRRHEEIELYTAFGFPELMPSPLVATYIVPATLDLFSQLRELILAVVATRGEVSRLHLDIEALPKRHSRKYSSETRHVESLARQRRTGAYREALWQLVKADIHTSAWAARDRATAARLAGDNIGFSRATVQEKVHWVLLPSFAESMAGKLYEWPASVSELLAATEDLANDPKLDGDSSFGDVTDGRVLGRFQASDFCERAFVRAWQICDFDSAVLLLQRITSLGRESGSTSSAKVILGHVRLIKEAGRKESLG